jgi:MFS transporter, AAHS family, 4-hydroxybenzoate transporter
VASESRPLSSAEIIDRRPLSRFQIWAIALCGVVLILEGFDAQIAGTLAPAISESLRIPLKAFGPILSSSLFGLMIAAMAVGPIADRWGRKWPVVISTIAFGIFSLFTARATSFNELLVFRFFTGLGLGGAMPNVVALAAEYSPNRLLKSFVAMLFAGMPLGGVICGLTGSALLPRWGWRPLFYIGGLLPFALSLFLIWVLPESVRFLIVRGGNAKRVSRIMRKISPDFARGNISAETVQDVRHAGLSVNHLFTEHRAAGTLLLWVQFFMNLLLLYFNISWLPGLLRQAGMSVHAGVLAISLFSSGGALGCFAQGPIIRKFGAHVLLFAEFGLSALFTWLMSLAAGTFSLVVPAALVLGFCVTGAQGGINALAASFYPTAIRSTGVGWALGIGRIGSIVGPLLAGKLLSAGWSPQQVFRAGAVPALCAMVAVLLTNRLKGSANAYRWDPDAHSG